MDETSLCLQSSGSTNLHVFLLSCLILALNFKMSVLLIFKHIHFGNEQTFCRP